MFEVLFVCAPAAKFDTHTNALPLIFREEAYGANERNTLAAFVAAQSTTTCGFRRPARVLVVIVVVVVQPPIVGASMALT